MALIWVIFDPNFVNVNSWVTVAVLSFSNSPVTFEPRNFFKVWKKILDRLFETVRISYISMSLEKLGILCENFGSPKLTKSLESGSENDFSVPKNKFYKVFIFPIDFGKYGTNTRRNPGNRSLLAPFPYFS